ncbi:MAG: multifunctional oxoglutarate decarboxylase/oxoglutarate dehydrogenase thiamine pyrophosphate-binding subunit/dihydrolipoyllysine-residue succinyltransferase subunit [Candidatus Dormibacteria bacterium]
MATDTLTVSVPEMGESVTEGTVSNWIHAPGDFVRQGDPLVELTTDKVDVEVPAPVAGVLLRQLASEGDTLAVGAPLLELDPNAAAPADLPAANGPTARPKYEPVAKPAPVTPAPPAPAGNGVPAAAPPASPMARRMALERGIDLGLVVGRGAEGRVRPMDVLEAAQATPVRIPAPRVAPELTAARTPVKGAAAALADHMQQSLEVPTATSFRTVAVEVLDARRRQLNNALRAAGTPAKVSFTHLVGHAIARAAAEWPVMNTSFEREDQGPVRVDPGTVNLGLAVDVERRDGTRSLVVPVIRDAHRLDFAAFREVYEDLVARARTGKLTADELRGATLTLTNPGGLGTTASVPRLMKGQGTIVATGAIGYPPGLTHLSEDRANQLGVRRIMTMTSTYDHRVIQGAESGSFLRRVEELLHGADSFYEDVFASLSLPSESLVPPADPGLAATPAAAPLSGPTQALADMDLVYAATAGMALVKAHRTHGHLAARLDPLGHEPPGDPALEPETVRLTPEMMARVPARLMRVYVPGQNLAEVFVELRATYCGTIAYEIEHLSEHRQRVWLREQIESGLHRRPLDREHQVHLLKRLFKVNAMEVFLRKTYLGQKTFSIEGLDSMGPMLEYGLERLADSGATDVVIGMAHRGRLNVIAHVVNRPYDTILSEFEGAHSANSSEGDITGDVKYHQGAEGTYVTLTGKPISVTLVPNPSHLEVINPVVEGETRARQTRRRSREAHHETTHVVPVVIHGDAAFAGQGVVAETLNLQGLDGYSTGGTLHIIANNQVGFTTSPREGRSTRYASDLAKGFDVPIIHVNADDPEACVGAMSLALAYRQQWGRDVLIDLIGYRRFGHNETDEPAYTQPEMYEIIRQHPPVHEIYRRQLVAAGVVTEAEADEWETAAQKRLQDVLTDLRARLAAGGAAVQQRLLMEKPSGYRFPTGVPEARLRSLNEELLATPSGFTVNPKLVRQLERRVPSLEDGTINWAHAEALAFASLVTEGVPVRLTGQDTERGTFSHRHLALRDALDNRRYAPIQHLVQASAPFELHNSPLSEMACVAFEYGYSVAAPEALVLWEAQYGDFANGAQVVMDQFVVSGLAKWGQTSRLTLLLPHGYEGAGPEHSSARLERFLQLAAEGNIRVANPTTAAQYFHLLRRQALFSEKRPLVVMTPKSTLRLAEAASSLLDLTDGSFEAILDDPLVAEEGRASVTRVILVSGKLYHELQAHALRSGRTDLAVVRLELLYPFPSAQLTELLASYPAAREVLWVQEEPKNSGAWSWVASQFGPAHPKGLRYIGRPRRASPSEGWSAAFAAEQQRILSEALAPAGSAPGV